MDIKKIIRIIKNSFFFGTQKNKYKFSKTRQISARELSFQKLKFVAGGASHARPLTGIGFDSVNQMRPRTGVFDEGA